MKIVEEHVELINDSVEEFDKAIELFKQGSPEQDFKDIELPQQERKETLEEASIINYKKLYEGEPLTQDVPIDAFKQGAKWQQERNYSEEEVVKILYRFHYDLVNSNIDTKEEWFEQFKKK